MATRHAEVLVVGRVQGVFYRGSTQEKANALGLVGTVQNLPDGSVRVIVEGEDQLIEQLVTWCRTGPVSAKIEHLSVRFSEPLGQFSKFTILR